MSVYLDTSVVVALFTIDPFAARASAYLRVHEPALVLGDFAAAEFSSAVARRVRMKNLTADQAKAAFANFDSWAALASSRVETTSGDIRASELILRRLDLNMRTPDALHIAVAQRLGAELATFDTLMAENARALGLSLAPV